MVPEDEAEAAETMFQRYIEDPFLADGKKFEARIFVAITSVEPLAVYMYRCLPCISPTSVAITGPTVGLPDNP